MTRYTELKHQLGVTASAGVDTLRRFGLNTEASMADDIDDMADFADVLVSAHAPAVVGDMRLNIAATDAGFRETSIQVIVDYIERASRYPNVRQINMHFAPKRWNDPEQTVGREGDYDLMIDGIRQIAAYCERHDLEVVLENLNSYWSDDIKETPREQVDWSGRSQYFGMAPEEWRQIALDVDRENVALCLDSSHVATYAHRFPEEQREERVKAFLSRPELIRHVHWNDNYLYDYRGRSDSHAPLDEGTLPTEMHRRIKYLDATLLMEHFYDLDVLEEELKFIDSL
jgi:sugar phosphate isomerase/epimerase